MGSGQVKHVEGGFRSSALGNREDSRGEASRGEASRERGEEGVGPVQVAPFLFTP